MNLCAVLGDSVVMSCSYKYPSGLTIRQAYWTKVDSGDPPDLREDPKYKERVSVTQYVTNRCDLHIHSVTLLDAGKYYCSFTAHNESQKWTEVPGVNLHVRGKEK